MRSLQDHPLGQRWRTDAGTIDHRKRTDAVLPARSCKSEIVFKIEHGLAAADHHIAVGAEFGELRDDRATSGNGQVAVTVVVGPKPEITVLALQIASLVHFDEQKARRSQREGWDLQTGYRAKRYG